MKAKKLPKIHCYGPVKIKISWAPVVDLIKTQHFHNGQLNTYQGYLENTIRKNPWGGGGWEKINHYKDIEFICIIKK